MITAKPLSWYDAPKSDKRVKLAESGDRKIENDAGSKQEQITDASQKSDKARNRKKNRQSSNVSSFRLLA